jgi:hypothetical protein
MERPSYRELDKKLAKAKTAILREKIFYLEPDVIAADLLEMDLLIEEQSKWFPKILDEINPNHYRGTRPPQRSYKNPILGLELFAFRWESGMVGCELYFKFALKGDNIWIVSFHPDSI